MSKTKLKEKAAVLLKTELGVKNDLALPRLIKIAVNTGVGRKEEKDIENISAHFEMLTGQKCSKRAAKKSIATFKTRKGVVVGLSCVLRGTRMYDFLERLISVAIPRLRDFRGISPESVDSSGNLTIGFKEHIVFPEIAGEDIKTPFGLEITLVTNSRSKEEALKLFKALGIPFKKS